jgi:hypothetical protein
MYWLCSIIVGINSNASQNAKPKKLTKGEGGGKKRYKKCPA